jgi:hypothetical protein
MAPKCGGWCTCLCPMNARMAEDRKRDIRDEVEFRQAQLNAQAQRLRGTVHMYMRDARMFVEQRDDTVARKMLVQKAMMEQRIAVMATHWSVLESVRVSLQPSEVRCVGDLITCRTILNKTGLEFIEPVRLEAPCPTPHAPPPSLTRGVGCGQVVRSEGDYEERHVDAEAVDVELRELQIEILPREVPTSVGDWLATDGDHGNHVRAGVASEQDMLGEEEDSGAGVAGPSGVADLIGEIFSTDHDAVEGAALLATIEQGPTGADSQQQNHSEPHLCAASGPPMEAAWAGVSTETEQLVGALSAQSDAGHDAAWRDEMQSQATAAAHEHKSE